MSENVCRCGSNTCDQDTERIEKIMKVIEECKGKSGILIEVLHKVQDIYGYLPLKVQKLIAKGLDIPLAEVYGVVTFYSQFSIEPKGKYKIQVCLGTACYVRGSSKVLDKLCEKLNTKVGKCTQDGKFSIEAARCLGACGLAPVLMINGEVYGKVTVEKLDEILAKYED
jgi:NADH-quinone oxidoreductase E subunit